MSRNAHRLFGALAVAAVVGALIWGFLVVGSPERRRLERLDDRRVQDLQRIVRQIQDMVYDYPREEGVLKRALPKDLEEVKAAALHREVTLTDPETGTPYVYRVTSKTTYELCATFALRRKTRDEVFWNHPAGDHCFTIDALEAP